MKKHFFLLFFSLTFWLNISSQITLTHNVGNTPIKTDWENCTMYKEYYARAYTLSDFGITTDEQFILKSAKIAISNIEKGGLIIINIYIIDDNFPASTPERISYGNVIETPNIGDKPEIIELKFSTPIVIPSKAKRILIEVQDFLSDKRFVMAGTEKDNDQSWYKGCDKYYPYISTDKMDSPKPNANFFINVTGEKRSLINTKSNTTLAYNIGDDVIETNMFSCSYSVQYWARNFLLKDFGISESEEYIIKSGSVAITESTWGANVKFNIYKVDHNFPASFKESDLIGSSQIVYIHNASSYYLKSTIYEVEFTNPIIIPSDVKEILVEVKKGNIPNASSLAFIGGTQEDTNDSWYKGCTRSGNSYNYNAYNSMNFFVTVNGEVKTIFPFEITNTNNCINFSNDFSLTNQTEIDTLTWNFDDPTTGVNNTSTDINTNHQFSKPGVYSITADVLHTDGTRYTIPKEIEIFDAPNVNPIVELKQCDNSDINGFSFFNLNEVKEEIITNSDDYTITFYEEKVDAENNGTAITNVTNYKNEIVSVDTIWARVENDNGCYRVSEVKLFVSTTQIPSTLLNSFYQCDDGINTTDGIATFDFSSVTSDIINIFPAGQQFIINYYRNEEDALSEENEIDDIANYQNIGYPNQQNIYIRVDSKFDNDCLGLGAHISLNVEKIPIANSVSMNPECDNDRDGFYSFNTSTIQTTIIGSQTNVTVSYFDESGIQLSSPLPNPFITSTQKITAKITNTLSQDLDGQCSDETTISFEVNSVPIANVVAPQSACDDDTDGIIGFDTSTIESTVLGSQTGLIVTYFDENNIKLKSPLPNPFYTASQTIRVRLENPVYDVCFEEASIDFIVREKPTFDLITEDIICMTNNPQLEITIENPNKNDNTYIWKDENNTTISNQAEATVIKGGVYKVIATSIYGCNSDEQEIEITESSASTININDIEVKDDSENNNIQISTTNLGLGIYEFRLLNENNTIVVDYQDEPYFENLEGGVYTVEVNDKNGCGNSPFEVSLLEFPKFFTPNNDNENDFWQIKGLSKNFYKSGKISVFDRYGKLITNFTIDDIGWDGTYNGSTLSSNDFWFYVVLVNQKDIARNRSGNFSLLRK